MSGPPSFPGTSAICGHVQTRIPDPGPIFIPLPVEKTSVSERGAPRPAVARRPRDGAPRGPARARPRPAASSSDQRIAASAAIFATARPPPPAPASTTVNVAEALPRSPSAVTAATGSLTVSINARPALTTPLHRPELVRLGLLLAVLGLLADQLRQRPGQLDLAGLVAFDRERERARLYRTSALPGLALRRRQQHLVCRSRSECTSGGSA